MANFATLADLLAACVAKAKPDACQSLYAAAAGPKGETPADTLTAAEAIARYPLAVDIKAAVNDSGLEIFDFARIRGREARQRLQGECRGDRRPKRRYASHFLRKGLAPRPERSKLGERRTSRLL
jgi:hypothetical protein